MITAKFFPFREMLYLKTGIGISNIDYEWITDLVDDGSGYDYYNYEMGSGTGLAFVLGTGFHLKLGETFHVVLNGEWSHHKYRGERVSDIDMFNVYLTLYWI